MSSRIIYTYRRHNRQTTALHQTLDAALQAAREHAANGVTPLRIEHVDGTVMLAGDELTEAIAGGEEER